MKVIMQQYGSSIIALSVFALLLGLCMSVLEKGSESALGVFVSEAIGEKVSVQNQAFDVYRNQKLPEIFSYSGYEFRTGEYTAVSSCFYGKDSEGMTIPVNVNEISGEKEERFSTVTQNGIEYFYFELSGTYHLVLETEDKNGKRQIAYVKIFVNESLE
uniref:hypothetical protein n=1 Tax=Agathobacter sp. TaxID=2021311 RepID=UPI0040575818